MAIAVRLRFLLKRYSKRHPSSSPYLIANRIAVITNGKNGYCKFTSTAVIKYQRSKHPEPSYRLRKTGTTTNFLRGAKVSSGNTLRTRIGTILTDSRKRTKALSSFHHENRIENVRTGTDQSHVVDIACIPHHAPWRAWGCWKVDRHNKRLIRHAIQAAQTKPKRFT